jgi:hypothetical protein
MLAGVAVALVELWKGVAVEFGRDNICTFTGRWRSRDSVKNFALNAYKIKEMGKKGGWYLFTPGFRRFTLLRGSSGASHTSQSNVHHLMFTIRHK